MTCNVVANSVNSGAGCTMFNALGTGIATAAALSGGIGGIVVGGIIYLSQVGAQNAIVWLNLVLLSQKTI